MNKPQPQRLVRCIHCATLFHVAQQASTLSCPACYRRVRVDDVVVDNQQETAAIETCGLVIVGKRGSIAARVVRAGAGVEVLGKLAADRVEAGRVYIGPKAQWAGDCRACSIIVETGAQVARGRFEVLGQVVPV